MTEGVELNDAIASVIKGAWCQNELARGINESCRAIEAWFNDDKEEKSALCILAEDVTDENYKKLIVALCNTENVFLVLNDLLGAHSES